MVPCMDVRDERFDAVGYVLHRTTQHDAEADHGHVLVVHVKLHAKRTADIGRDHPHAGFWNAVMARIDVLELIGRLRRMMHRQLLLAGVIIRDDRARLHGHGRMTPEVKLLLDDMRGVGEDVVHPAGVDLAVEAKIAAQFRRDDGRTGLAGGIDIDDSRQFIEFDWQRSRRHPRPAPLYPRRRRPPPAPTTPPCRPAMAAAAAISCP